MTSRRSETSATGASRFPAGAARLVLLVATVLATATACVLPIPTPDGKTLEGRQVQSSDLEFLKPSVTTKTEVIQRLGPPTIVWRDENILVYRWVQREGMVFWAIAGGYNATGGVIDVTAEFAYLVKFDAGDRFVAAETIRKPSGTSFGDMLLHWRDASK